MNVPEPLGERFGRSESRLPRGGGAPLGPLSPRFWGRLELQHNSASLIGYRGGGLGSGGA